MVATVPKKSSPFAARAKAFGLVIFGAILVVFILQYATPYIPLSGDLEQAFADFTVSKLNWFRLPDDFVFVALDDLTLNLSGADESEIAASPELQAMQAEFPWSRDIYASLIERLVKAGARVVGIDILFTTPRSGDEALHNVIEKYPDRVVLASNISQTILDGGKPSPPQLALPVEGILLMQQAVPPRVGFVNFWQEETGKRATESGVISEFSYQIRMSQFTDLPSNPYEPVYLSLAASMLQMAGLANHFPDHPVRFLNASRRTVPIISLYSLFVPSLWKTNLKNGEVFRNKIVVVGPLAKQFQDVQTIPGETISGPMLHILAMGALLKNAFYTIVSPKINSLIICGLGVVIFLVTLPIRRFWLLPLLMLVLLAAYFCFVLLLFSKWYILPGIVFPSLAIISATLSLFTYQYSRDFIEKLHTRRTLERYVSRDLVEGILDDRGDFAASLEGTRKDVAILFSDIRGFTRFSENRDPHDVVRHLNEYLSAMVEVVFRFNGTLDKFIGDAVMAEWGSVHSEGAEKDVAAAVHAAIEMLAALQRLNEKWHMGSGEKFSIGIGINFGPVVFGNIGSEQKSDLTVIGDTVNLASRIESLTKFYRVPILLGADAAALMEGKIPLRFVDRIAVSGRETEVDMFTPLLNVYNEPWTPPWLETYEEGVKCFRARDFLRAKQIFEKCSQGEDELIRHYIQRCEEFSACPPLESEPVNLRPTSGK